jgi:type I restriction enzyme S subunit
MSEWLTKELGKLIKTNFSSIGKNYPFQQIAYLDTGSITKGKIDRYQFLNLIDAPSRAKRLVQENDIIYSAVRPIQRHFGFITAPPENLVVSTGFVVITCNQSELNPKYLYYYLTSDPIVEELDVIADASTSAYPSLKPSDIEKLELYFPSDVDEQKAIAAVLSSLDNKIDLLHRQNLTLEAMAETLFRQWFIEEAQEDWKEGVLGDVLQLVYGKALKDEIRTGSGFPVVGSSGIVGYHSEYLVEGPGIVIGRKGTLGKVIYLFENFFPIDTTYYIQPKICFDCLFYQYFLLKTLNFESSDSAVPGLNRDIALSEEIKLAPLEKIDAFNEHCRSLFGKLEKNISQLRTLEKLRDTLLPKLMSGEIRIKLDEPRATP